MFSSWSISGKCNQILFLKFRLLGLGNRKNINSFLSSKSEHCLFIKTTNPQIAANNTQTALSLEKSIYLKAQCILMHMHPRRLKTDLLLKTLILAEGSPTGVTWCLSKFYVRDPWVGYIRCKYFHLQPVIHIINYS